MKSVGMKSLVWSCLYAFLLFEIVFTGSLDADFFTNTDIRLAFGLGLFSTFMTAFTIKAFRLDETSATALHYIPPTQPLFGTRLIDYKGHKISITTDVKVRAYELSGFTKGVLVFASFLSLGIWTFQFRQLNAMLEVDEKSFLGKKHLCKFEDQKPQEELKSRPECRLILRAFELGYAKDLGSCGKADDEKPVLCELQHPDEPNIHFAYRLIKKFSKMTSESLGQKSFEEIKKDLKKDTENYGSMMGLMQSDINNDPSSAHFIFTTLNNPVSGISLAFKNFLSPSHCVRWYSQLPNVPRPAEPDVQNSRFLEHSLGHLLFDTSYPRGVAQCNEVHIEWGIKDSMCEDLMSSPQKILSNLKLDKKMDDVLAYYAQKRKIRSNLKYRTPAEFASFNCLSYGSIKDEVISRDVTYKGEKLQFRWYKTAAVSEDSIPNVAFFKKAAKLLAPGFDYGMMQTKSSPTVDGASTISEDLFAQADFRLSRLGFLRDADIFMGSPWLEKRPDIMEVYPYYLHLNRYVQVFRDRYRQTRGSFQ